MAVFPYSTLSANFFVVHNVQKAILNEEAADSLVSEDFVQTFATVIDSKWPLIASLLSFTTAEIEQIKREVTGVPSVKAATTMMNKWRERATATYSSIMTKVSNINGYSTVVIA